MKRQESIRTCKVMRMKTWSRRCERARGREGERGGGNQRVPVCLALLRLIRGRTWRLASYRYGYEIGCGYEIWLSAFHLPRCELRPRPTLIPATCPSLRTTVDSSSILLDISHLQVCICRPSTVCCKAPPQISQINLLPFCLVLAYLTSDVIASPVASERAS